MRTNSAAVFRRKDTSTRHVWGLRDAQFVRFPDFHRQNAVSDRASTTTTFLLPSFLYGWWLVIAKESDIMFTVVSVWGVHIVVDVDCSPLGCDNVLVGKLLRLENHLKFFVRARSSLPGQWLCVVCCCCINVCEISPQLMVAWHQIRWTISPQRTSD
jgi:hypothetical protein